MLSAGAMAWKDSAAVADTDGVASMNVFVYGYDVV